MHQLPAPTTEEVLGRLARALDEMEQHRETASPADRLALVETAHRLTDRLRALTLTLVAEADAADAAMVTAGYSLRSWLSDHLLLTGRQAGALVHAGTALAEHAPVRDAAVSGQVNLEQARAIGTALDRLPGELTRHRRLIADVALAEHALPVQHLMPDGRLTPHVLSDGLRLDAAGHCVWDGLSA